MKSKDYINIASLYASPEDCNRELALEIIKANHESIDFELLSNEIAEKSILFCKESWDDLKDYDLDWGVPKKMVVFSYISPQEREYLTAEYIIFTTFPEITDVRIFLKYSAQNRVRPFIYINQQKYNTFDRNAFIPAYNQVIKDLRLQVKKYIYDVTLAYLKHIITYEQN